MFQKSGEKTTFWMYQKNLSYIIMVKSYTNLNWFSRRITEASTVAFSTSKSRSPRYCFLRSAQWWLCNSMGHRGAWWTHTTRGGWQATKTDGQTAWVVERCFFDAILPDPVDILVPSLKCLCSIFSGANEAAGGVQSYGLSWCLLCHLEDAWLCSEADANRTISWHVLLVGYEYEAAQIPLNIRRTASSIWSQTRTHLITSIYSWGPTLLGYKHFLRTTWFQENDPICLDVLLPSCQVEDLKSYKLPASMDVVFVHLRTGRVVTWGHPKYGGLCTHVAEQLRASMWFNWFVVHQLGNHDVVTCHVCVFLFQNAGIFLCF